MKLTAFSASLMVLMTGLVALSFIPSAAAHDCDALSPTYCGDCSDPEHSGTHSVTIGDTSVPYCWASPLPEALEEGIPEDVDPVCIALDATGAGDCN